MAGKKKKDPAAIAIDDMLDTIRTAIGDCTVPTENQVYEALLAEAEGWKMRLEELAEEEDS